LEEKRFEKKEKKLKKKEIIERCMKKYHRMLYVKDIKRMK